MSNYLLGLTRHGVMIFTFKNVSCQSQPHKGLLFAPELLYNFFINGTLFCHPKIIIGKNGVPLPSRNHELIFHTTTTLVISSRAGTTFVADMSILCVRIYLKAFLYSLCNDAIIARKLVDWTTTTFDLVQILNANCIWICKYSYFYFNFYLSSSI